jgi:uncharacterized protein (TIGR02996 family)
MTGDELLAAVLAARDDDDAPRLVYADWLLEHGDRARGELIVAQCAGRHDEADALIAAHGARWAPGAMRWRFERGFVVSATVAAAALLDGRAEPLFAREPLRGLRVDGGNQEGDGTAMVEALRASPIARLYRLALQRCGMGSAGLAALLAWPAIDGLAELDLWALDRFGDGDVIGVLAAAPALRALRVLRLDYLLPESDDLAPLVASTILPRDLELSVERVIISEGGVAALRARFREVVT